MRFKILTKVSSLPNTFSRQINTTNKFREQCQGSNEWLTSDHRKLRSGMRLTTIKTITWYISLAWAMAVTKGSQTSLRAAQSHDLSSVCKVQGTLKLKNLLKSCIWLRSQHCPAASNTNIQNNVLALQKWKPHTQGVKFDRSWKAMPPQRHISKIFSMYKKIAWYWMTGSQLMYPCKY